MRKYLLMGMPLQAETSFRSNLKAGTKAFSVIAVLTILSACDAGNGEGLDVNGRPLPTNQDGNNGSSLFDQIQNDIFTPECATSGCHSGASSPLGLNLASGKAFDNLVNIPSAQVDGLLLVEPFNDNASYLVSKIEGTGDGELMPLGRSALSDDQKQLIRNWITAGALPPASDSNHGGDVDDNSATNAEFAPTLSDIQEFVFDPKCKICHSGENPAGDLNLEDGQSYAQLINRPLQYDQDNDILVIPGEVENSFLINKLTGEGLGNINNDTFKGRRMPLGGPFLDDSIIQSVRDWINNGAKDN